ncbi:universal stress protein [Ectothiorhodospiraceae bacterium BW-2]|nr:universal stress protein [Ectothiorhodospiraceae bacterium BW-2]
MQRFKNILYVYEPSVAQQSSIARAVELAQHNQAHLTLLAVVSEQIAGIRMVAAEEGRRDLNAIRVAQQCQQLESLMAGYDQRGSFAYKVVVGTRFLEVIRAVLRDNYDLVMKPAEDPDWMNRLFGSDDMHLLRKCPVPVWLMKSQERPSYGSVVAALDFNPYQEEEGQQALNDLILSLSGSIALSYSAEFHLLHSWEAPEMGLVRLWADDPDLSEMVILEDERRQHKAGMDRVVERLNSLIGVEASRYLAPKQHLPKGSARKVIPSVVQMLQADIVVMGTVARTNIPGFFIGNTAEAVFDQLQCSVLAIKPPGFVTPVTLE